MTQEQRKATLKAEAKFYDVDDFDLTSNFSFGIEHTLSNPTDFGLVTLETMFEFAEWCVGLGYEFYDSLSFGNVYTKPNDKTLKTTAQIFQEFQLFTTQNKEK